MVKRGVNMGVHVDMNDATQVTRAKTLACGWWRWGPTPEYPDLCSTPDNTSSRGTLSVATVLTGHAAAYSATSVQFPAGRKVIFAILGVPKAVNARSTTGSGGRHRFAVTPAGRALMAADAVTLASTIDPARGILEIWNEPQIPAFSQDQGYLGGSEATAQVFALMVADIVDAVRAAYPTLPIMLGSMATRGDMNNPADIAGGYCGHTYGLAAVQWLIANRPGSIPDLAGFHPYGFSGGKNDPTSDPYSAAGWNGHQQAIAYADGLAAMGCPKRDALVGTGTGAGRLSSKLVISEYGEPSQDPTQSPITLDFDETWQQTHAQHDQEMILWEQGANRYHPIQVRYNFIDRLASGSGTRDDHLGDHTSAFVPKAAAAVFATYAAEDLTGQTGPTVPHRPLSPLPPAVTARVSGPASHYDYIETGLGSGGGPLERAYTRDEQHPRLNVCRGVVCLSGAGGFGFTCTPAGDQGVTAGIAEAIAYVLKARPGQPEGYTFLGTTPGSAAHKWGNDSAMTALAADIATFQGNGKCGGAKAGKVALMGISMGHLTAFNYAVRHPADIAGVMGFIPVSSLVQHYNAGVETGLASGGFPTEINTAYGLSTSPNAVTLDATVKAQRDPLTRAAELDFMPWGLSYNLDDFVVAYSSVEAFISAKGGQDAFRFLQRNPTGDHTATHITGPQLLEFLDSLDW